MKKYLVDVYLPSIGKHYDVFLPTGKKIGEAAALLAHIAESLSHGGYRNTGEAVLLDAITGEPFRLGETVFDAGIRNSSRLILV